MAATTSLLTSSRTLCGPLDPFFPSSTCCNNLPLFPLLILSSTEVVGIHASTLILFAWVGVPLLRFHLHPSQCRSIGQTIGLTAYSP